MELILDLFFLLVIGYFSFEFYKVLDKMKKKVILPSTADELGMIRKHPQKQSYPPTYASQKVGIIIYILVLLYVMSMFIAGTFFNNFNWSFYLLVFLPLGYSYDLLNQFAFTEDGVLCGSRFVAWKKVKSYTFIPINLNHKYYGYSKEANDGYELKIKSKFRTFSCVITSDNMRNRVEETIKECGVNVIE